MGKFHQALSGNYDFEPYWSIKKSDLHKAVSRHSTYPIKHCLDSVEIRFERLGLDVVTQLRFSNVYIQNKS
jgi:hypothetical protein